MNTNLLDETLALAKGADLTAAEICSAADVKVRWYYKFLAGEIPDPGVRRIQRLHDYLSSKKAQEQGAA